MFRYMIIVLCTSSALTLGICGMDLEIVVALGALALGAFLGGIWHDPVEITLPDNRDPRPVFRTSPAPLPRRARPGWGDDDVTHELTLVDIGPPGSMPRFERTLGPRRPA